MLEALFKAGPLGQPGMGGHVSLSWQEVAAFAQATGRIDSPTEMESLFDMSRAYLDGLDRGADPFAVPPYEKD